MKNETKKENIYYSDIHYKKLRENRKKEIKFEYLLSIFLIIILVIFDYINLVYLSNKNLNILFYIVSIFFIVLLIRDRIYFFAKKLDEGITLTESQLNLFGKKYSLKSIIHCEVVDFIGTGGIYSISNPTMDRWLALIVKDKKGKKRIILLRSSETTNIVRLCDLIREIKGFPPQMKIEEYGSVLGYRKWEKELLKKIKYKK